MFTNFGTSWFTVITMIGLLLVILIRLFYQRLPLRFPKTTIVSLFFLTIIALSTLVEILRVSINFSQATQINSFLFPGFSFMAYTLVMVIILIGLIPRNGNEKFSNTFIIVFFIIFFSISVVFEVSAWITLLKKW